MNIRAPRKREPFGQKQTWNTRKNQGNNKFMRKSVGNNDESIKNFRKTRKLVRQEKIIKSNYQTYQIKRQNIKYKQPQLSILEEKENILAKYINQCQLIESTEITCKNNRNQCSSPPSMLQSLLYSDQKYTDNQFPRYQNKKQMCSTTVQSIQSIISLQPDQSYRFESQLSETPIRQKNMFFSEATSNQIFLQCSQDRSSLYLQSIDKVDKVSIQQYKQKDSPTFQKFDDNSLLLEGYTTSSKKSKLQKSHQMKLQNTPKPISFTKTNGIETNSNTNSKQTQNQSLLIEFTQQKLKNSSKFSMLKKQRLSFENCMSIVIPNNQQLYKNIINKSDVHNWKSIFTMQRQLNNLIIRKTKMPFSYIQRQNSIEGKILQYLSNINSNNIYKKSNISIIHLFQIMKSITNKNCNNEKQLQFMKLLFQMKIPATLQQIGQFLSEMQGYQSFNRFFEMKFMDESTCASWIFHFDKDSSIRKRNFQEIPFEIVQFWNVLDKVGNEFKQQLAIWIHEYHLKK